MLRKTKTDLLKIIVNLKQELIDKDREILRLLLEQESEVGKTSAYQELLEDRQKQVCARFRAEAQRDLYLQALLDIIEGKSDPEVAEGYAYIDQERRYKNWIRADQDLAIDARDKGKKIGAQT